MHTLLRNFVPSLLRRLSGGTRRRVGCCSLRALPSLACLTAVVVSTSVHANTPFHDVADARVDYARAETKARQSCKDMSAQSDYRFTIVSAKEIPVSGPVPAHCRLSGLIGAEIRFEVNLPLRWNRRIYMYGNGGLAGTPAIDPGKQAVRNNALQHGFATAYTDTGHDRRVEPGGTFAHNNFNKLVDYGFRAVHLTIVSAKSLAATFYNRPHRFSYWDGCSTGGRQAMISAQRFPDDFDGIVAGAPASDYSGLKFSQAWRVAAIQRGGFSAAEVEDLAGHIYRRCDAIDGVQDGLLSDPRGCDFDPEQHLPKCAGDDQVDCYTPAEITALKTYYAPVALAGKEVYPAMPVGSEISAVGADGVARPGWVPWLINENGPVLLDLLGSDFFRYMAFVKDDPDFDWTTFDFQSEPDNLAEFRDIVDALDTDLSRLRDSGGKVLSYFGWADPDINPLTLIAYQEAVLQNDPEADDYLRVFMVPGLFHCRGGPGPNRFDVMSPLIDWVEKGVAPEVIPAWAPARPGVPALSRPLCAHPKAARFVAGDPNSAASFQCE